MRFIIACVVLGLEELHQKNVCYGDLKLENILICQRGYLKLTDFGLAQRLSSKHSTYKQDSARGTLVYLAPEIVEDQIASMASDLWSLGILAHELIFHEPPYTDEDTIQSGIFRRTCAQDEKHRIWKHNRLSKASKNLIDSLLRVNPTERLGYNHFDQIREHPFFEGFDW